MHPGIVPKCINCHWFQTRDPLSNGEEHRVDHPYMPYVAQARRIAYAGFYRPKNWLVVSIASDHPTIEQSEAKCQPPVLPAP